MKTLREFAGSLKALLAQVPDDDEGTETAIALEAGKPVSVECARSGVFVDMHGSRVVFTPEVLANMASSFDQAEEHKIKIGHKPIDTDTPDYGDVTALAYDAKKDRLLATLVPTEITVEKNRKEGFRRASLEARGKTSSGPWNFEHLALLGARRPGVDNLAPIALAKAAGEGVAVFLEACSEFELGTPDPRPEVLFSIQKPIDKSATVPSNEDTEPEGKKTMDEKTLLAQADRLRKQVADGAADQAKAFIEANQKRIPLALRKAGVEAGLAALLAADALAETPIEIKFAVPDGEKKTREVTQTPSGFVKALLAALPEQTTRTEETEVSADGADGAVPTEIHAAEPLNPESVEIDLAIQDELKAAKARGENVTYLDAYRSITARSTRAS